MRSAREIVTLIPLIATLVPAVFAEGIVGGVSPVRVEARDGFTDDGKGTPYIVEKSDNICGLDEPKQLSNPAKVDYDALLEVTPQIKQMKKDKIDPNSARGIQLRTEAEALVRDTCEKLRAEKSYCSVWKKIERRDGTKLTDITEKVKKEITGEK